MSVSDERIVTSEASEERHEAAGTTRLERTHERREELRLEGALRSMQMRAKAEKLIARVLSGFIYAAVVLGCIAIGPKVTAVLIAVMSWMCASEVLHMMRLAGRTPNEIVALAASAAFPLVTLLPGDYTTIVLIALWASCVLWYIGIPSINVLDVAITIFVALYTGYMLASLVTIRAWDPGLRGGVLTLAVFASIWFNDTCAFFVGTRFGKHKMAPRISPKKSWEGFAGGMFGSVAAWLLLYAVRFVPFLPAWCVVPISLKLCFVLGIAEGLAGVLGDLFESRIKRGVGVKDSGDIMPGHGGLLDRSDSLIFGCVIARIILSIGGIL